MPAFLGEKNLIPVSTQPNKFPSWPLSRDLDDRRVEHFDETRLINSHPFNYDTDDLYHNFFLQMPRHTSRLLRQRDQSNPIRRNNNKWTARSCLLFENTAVLRWTTLISYFTSIINFQREINWSWIIGKWIWNVFPAFEQQLRMLVNANKLNDSTKIWQQQDSLSVKNFRSIYDVNVSIILITTATKTPHAINA